MQPAEKVDTAKQDTAKGGMLALCVVEEKI